MDPFGKFDDTNAVSRFLILLLETGNGLGVTDIHNRMSSEFGVGRGATDTARKICDELALIDTEPVDIGTPRKIISHKLTSKGRIVAEKLLEIKQVLME